MHGKPSPATPDPVPVREALQSSAPLVRLGQLMRDSRARYDVVRRLLPHALASHVEPGPLDAEGWSLLAANGAVAAKLRQFQPRLEDALRAAGWPTPPIRIKVLTR